MSNEHEDFDVKQEDSDLNQEDFDVKEEEIQESPKTDPFDRLMFGQRAKRTENNSPEEQTHGSQADGVDYTQLMDQLGDIMASIDNLKPAIKELSPLLDYFRKK